MSRDEYNKRWGALTEDLYQGGMTWVKAEQAAKLALDEQIVAEQAKLDAEYAAEHAFIYQGAVPKDYE